MSHNLGNSNQIYGCISPFISQLVRCLKVSRTGL